MSEYEERSLDDLTEEPSEHRIEQLREKGTIAQSKELSGTVAFLGVMMAIYFMSGNFVGEVTSLMKDVFSKDIINPSILGGSGGDWRVYTDLGVRCGKIIVFAFGPIAMAGLVLGLLTSVAQVGFLFTTETLNPDFERVNPVSGLMRVFSLKSLVESIKSVVKLAVVIGALYAALKAQLSMLPNIIGFNMQQILAYIGTTSTRAFGVAGIMLLAVGGFDYWIQWRRWRKQAMMTKAEAKRESKEREGDPQIKARIKSIQREAARKRMMRDIPKADVIITNPTHIAIAIVYEPDAHMAPKVVAKGADFLAQKIKEVAREHGIPTVENKPLARTLYKHVKVGQMIPRSLYKAVAEILAYVFKLKGRKLGAGSTPGPHAPK